METVSICPQAFVSSVHHSSTVPNRDHGERKYNAVFFFCICNKTFELRYRLFQLLSWCIAYCILVKEIPLEEHPYELDNEGVGCSFNCFCISTWKSTMYAYSDSMHLQCQYNGIPNQVNQGVEKDWHKILTEKTVIFSSISLWYRCRYFKLGSKHKTSQHFYNPRNFHVS